MRLGTVARPVRGSSRFLQPLNTGGGIVTAFPTSRGGVDQWSSTQRNAVSTSRLGRSASWWAHACRAYPRHVRAPRSRQDQPRRHGQLRPHHRRHPPEVEPIDVGIAAFSTAHALRTQRRRRVPHVRQLRPRQRRALVRVSPERPMGAAVQHRHVRRSPRPGTVSARRPGGKPDAGER